MSITAYSGHPLTGMTFKHPQLGENACPTPAAIPSSESLAALPGALQGKDTSNDLLRGELSHPIGFWVVCCDSLVAFLPTDSVRSERRA